jgi:hypothetical protein
MLVHATAKGKIEIYTDLFVSNLDSFALAPDYAVAQTSAVETQSYLQKFLREAKKRRSEHVLCGAPRQIRTAAPASGGR